MLPDEVSRAELASLLELTGRHVDRLAKDGLVKRVREGWFELGASVQGFIKHRERIAEEKFGAGSYTDARTALTREKAMEARAARLEREGGLVPVLDLERAWTAVFAAVRSRLLGIPNRVAPKVLRVKGVVEVAELIRREIYAALDHLSRSTPAATRYGVARSSDGIGQDDGALRPGRRRHRKEDLDAEADQPGNGRRRGSRALDAEPGSEPAAGTAASPGGTRRGGAARAGRASAEPHRR